MDTSDTLFTVYWIALIGSGIAMLAIAGTGFGEISAGQRAINAVFGLGFLGYGVYLGLFFNGGSYLIFFKAFILPVLLVANAIRSSVSHRNQRNHTPQPPMQGYPAPPMQGYPAPPMQGYPAPAAGAVPQPPANAMAQPPANTIGQPPASASYQSPIQPG
jgi:hypothetical protein